MPFKILFADDSMTAQNMGTKILSEAGYEVVAVSNGAAAIKKIAEHKPDIVILDVYMPGYSGLEVCEKLRASIDTLNTPVLLTVGKMEPYRNEDANRVKADGIIVKPFEASDLLAIIKKLEERITPPPPPLADQTIFLDRPANLVDDFERDSLAAQSAQANMAHDAEFRPTKAVPSVEVPDHMTASAAFSHFMGPEEGISVPPPPMPEVTSSSPAEFLQAPVSDVLSASEQPAPPPVPESALVETVPSAVPGRATTHTSWGWAYEQHEVAVEGEVGAYVAPPPPPPVVQETVAPPVNQEPPAGNLHGLERSYAPEERAVPPRTELHPVVGFGSFVENSSAPISNVAAPIPLAPERTAPETYPIDPELVTDRTAMSEFTTKFGVNKPEDVPVGIYSPEDDIQEGPTAELSAQELESHEPVIYQSATAPIPGPAASLEEDDFEARVAAAMAAYDQPQSAEETSVQPEAVHIVEPGHDLEHTTTSFALDVPVHEASEPEPPSVPSVPGVALNEIEHVPVEHTPVEQEPHGKAHEQFVPVHVGETPEFDAEVLHEQAVQEVVHELVISAPALDKSASALAPTPAEEATTVAGLVHKAAEAVPDSVTASVADVAPDMLAQAVHRALERLKPQLIEEIARELNAVKSSEK